jgi:hypothetical protein
LRLFERYARSFKAVWCDDPVHNIDGGFRPYSPKSGWKKGGGTIGKKREM